MTTKFRTLDEMWEVYKKISHADKPHPPNPYVIQVDKGKQHLVFFGSEHSNDPEHLQFQELRKLWVEWLKSTQKNKSIVFIEGMGWPLINSPKKSIQQYSKSGYMVYLAHSAGRKYQSAEPDRLTEIKHLRKKFSQEDIMIYYFVRMIPQWQRRQPQPEFNKYMQHEVLDRYKKLTGWKGDYFKLSGMRNLIREKSGVVLQSNLTKALRTLYWPQKSGVSDASSNFRDMYIFEQIKKYWGKGYSLFIVYGSGHAIVLEPALKQLGDK